MSVTLKIFQKKWKCNLKETDRKCQDLFLEEYYEKSFFGGIEISGKRIDI